MKIEGLLLTDLGLGWMLHRLTLSNLIGIVTLCGAVFYLFNQVMTARKNWKNRNN